MQKIKFKCLNCQTTLTAAAKEAGSVSQCPKCGVMLKSPFPGFDRGTFIGWKAASYFGLVIIGAAGAGVVALPLTLGLAVWLAHQRAINIGHSPWMCVAALIPGSVIYFAIRESGAAKSK